MFFVLVTSAIFDSILSILLRRRVSALCKSILVPCNEASGNAVKRNPALRVLNKDYSDECHMHYLLHYCDVLLMNQYEIMVGYHFPY